MITIETVIFNDIRTEKLNHKENMNPKRLKGFLDESEMNALEIKLNAVIEILDNKKKEYKICNRLFNWIKIWVIGSSKRILWKIIKQIDGFAYRESIC